MGLFDNYKIKLLLKKAKSITTQRKVSILPVENYRSILIISNEADDTLEKNITSAFKNSNITQLYSRSEKIEDSSNNDNIYTYHISDLGFGSITNQRLLDLLDKDFDLIIDFSDKITEFNYFIKIATTPLKIGDLHSTKNYLYDLLVDRGNSNSEFIKNITLQINTLNQ